MRQYSKLIVKRPFAIKGKRGRPLQAEVGDVFLVMSPEYCQKESGNCSIARANGKSEYLVGAEVITEYFSVVQDVVHEYSREQLESQYATWQHMANNALKAKLALEQGIIPPQFVGSVLWDDELKQRWIDKCTADHAHYSQLVNDIESKLEQMQ